MNACCRPALTYTEWTPLNKWRPRGRGEGWVYPPPHLRIQRVGGGRGRVSERFLAGLGHGGLVAETDVSWASRCVVQEATSAGDAGGPKARRPLKTRGRGHGISSWQLGWGASSTYTAEPRIKASGRGGFHPNKQSAPRQRTKPPGDYYRKPRTSTPSPTPPFAGRGNGLALRRGAKNDIMHGVGPSLANQGARAARNWRGVLFWRFSLFFFFLFRDENAGW